MSNDMQSDDSTILPEAMSPTHTKSVNVLNGGIAVDSEHVDIHFEEGVCYNGEVNLWKRTHGFLKHVNENDVSTSFFFHCSNVNSSDKRVLLRKNMAVRFKVQRGEDGKKDSAVDVESRNGLPLNFHAKHGPKDTYDREIQYDGRFFNGTVKFFSRKRSYGRIEAVQEELESVGAPIEEIGLVYFKEIDIDAADFPVKIDRGDEVRFQMFNSSRGWGGMNVQMQNGEQMPMFTEEDREAKRLEREARREEMKEERRNNKRDGDNSDDENRKGGRRPNKKKPKKKNQKRNNRRETRDEAEKVAVNYEEINANQRFIGTVNQFAIHRYGFLTPDEPEQLMTFGHIKNSKLCFRSQEIQTDQRPARVDNDMKVSFTIVRLGDKNTLYANDIRTTDGQFIISERPYEAPEPKELLSGEIVEGTVSFYNWRRGHGRIVIDGEDESNRYFFHRDDLRSEDKVPGVSDGARVTCQKVNDPKGAAVTNIMDENRGMLSGFGAT